MVPQQILRVAAGLAAIATAAAPAAAQTVERTAVIDLRPADLADRQPALTRVTDQLRDLEGIWPVDDVALASALAGERHDPHATEAAEALDSAKRAYGSLDCPTAAAAGERAVNALAATQAAGGDVDESLVQAYAYVLLCSADDPARALAVAHQLRALGADPPPGVSRSVWDKYPAVDATSNVYLVEVTIASEPGAEVWVAHRKVGTAPVALHLPEGDYVVAAASARGVAVQRLALRGRAPRAVELAIAEAAADRWQPVRAWVASWRSGERAPTPDDIHGLLTTIDTRVAFLLTRDLARGTDRVEAWGIHPRRELKNALLIGAAELDELADLVGLVLRTTRAWDSGEPSPDEVPLPAPGEDAPPAKAKPWWVYAAIVGAVAVGGAVVLANDLADDKQVIRLRFP